jgi:hypothetical protein
MKTIIKRVISRLRGTMLKAVLLACLLLLGIKFNIQAIPGGGTPVQPVAEVGPNGTKVLANWVQSFQNFLKQHGVELRALLQVVRGNYIGGASQLLTKHLGMEQLGLSTDQLSLLQQIYNPLSTVINGDNSLYVQKFNKLAAEVDKASNTDLIADVLDPRMSLGQSKEAFKGSLLFIAAAKLQANEIRIMFQEIVSANSSNTGSGPASSGTGGGLTDLNSVSLFDGTNSDPNGSLFNNNSSGTGGAFNPSATYSFSSGVTLPNYSGPTTDFSSMYRGTLKARTKLMLNDAERIQLMTQYIHEMEILLAAIRLYKARAVNLVKAIVSQEQDGKMQYFGSGTK